MGFKIENGVLERYTEEPGVTEVVIPDSVTSIGDEAFLCCNSLASIVIPDSVTSIGNYAFYNCTNLASITISDGVTRIGDEVFSGCCSLTSITIPDSVTSIGFSAFSGCRSLTNIVIPDSVASIGYYAFYGCNSFTSIVIPDGVTSIGDFAFFGCSNLTSITIPNSVTSIGRYAFCGCRSLTSITIPNIVTSVGDSAFRSCSSLISITVPESVTSIGENAFEDCNSLTSITILDGVISVGKDAFLGCNKLKEIMSGISVLPDTKLKQIAAITYCSKPETFSDKQAASCQKYLFSKKKKLMPMLLSGDIVGTMEIFANAGKITVDNVDMGYLMPATEANAKRCIAYLQNWKNDHIEEDKPKSSEKKAAEEWPLAVNAREEKVLLAAKEKYGLVAYLKSRLKEEFSLQFEELPPVLWKDGQTVSPAALAWLLMESKAPAEDQNTQTTGACEVKSCAVHELAEALVSALETRSFQKALRDLADLCLKSSSQRKHGFIYLLCRYADEMTMTYTIRFVPKNASPKLARDFADAYLYSNTHAAMFYADKRGELCVYAKMRGLDEESFRNEQMMDIGLDANGEIRYDLGNQTVTAQLQDDMSFILILPNGKRTKIMPKKGTDPELYAEAHDNYDYIKKTAKRVFTHRRGILLDAYLKSKGASAAEWEKLYMGNPLLRNVACLLVWTQDAETFTVNNEGLVCADGSRYTMKNAEIRLAHTMEMQPDDVAAWQKYFVSNALKQPFEQIWEPAIDFSAVSTDRYRGAKLKTVWFRNMSMHGICCIWGAHYVGEKSSLHLADNSVDFDTDEDYDDTVDAYVLTIRSLKVNKRTRTANHALYLLDKWTIREQIAKDNLNVMNMLEPYNAAQITEFISRASEAQAVNLTAALMEYKQQHFPEYDAFSEFTLE